MKIETTTKSVVFFAENETDNNLLLTLFKNSFSSLNNKKIKDSLVQYSWKPDKLKLSIKILTN
jgi:hypothetical protein